MTISNATVEGILDRSRKIEFSKTVVLWIATIFYAIGWVVGKSFKLVWSFLAFVWVALVVGFNIALGKELP